jgi:serine O-acetyltransferase
MKAERFAALVMADVHRQYGKSSWRLVFTAVFARRTFRAVFTLRLCQAAAQHPLQFLLLPLCKLLHRFSCQLAGMDLPWSLPVGGGLAITHGWGLVLNPGAQLGRNITLFHGATLGRRDRIAADGSRSSGFPVLADGVWVGPHALVLGAVSVGAGARIAGGSVVTEDVPAACIVSGNPAQIIKRDCMPDTMNAAP